MSIAAEFHCACTKSHRLNRIGQGFSWMVVLALLGSVLLMSRCGKIEYSDDPALSLTFSTDTVFFDTVFTTIGSVTLPLKVFNPNRDAVLIDYIGLEGGADSPFRVNIDGMIGPEVEQWPLLAEDSMWIFLEVTVDPNEAALPFVIEDGLRFNTNGLEQRVHLMAWGQNAHFHGGPGQITALASCDEVWANDLPHVIYGIVQVEAGCKLTIDPGTQVHVHNGGGLLVYQSTLDVNGALGNEVVFQGDRLDAGYEDAPGQWGIELSFEFETDYGIEEVTAQRGGIWLFGGVGCTMDYAILKNGTMGLQVDTTGSASAPALQIRNSIIHNMSAYGLYAQGGTIDGYNNLIYDCGQSTAAFTLGGTYRMDHCTFVNSWSEGVRQSPSVLFTDWYEDVNGNIQVRSLEGSAFNNCIFWGNNHNLTDFDELVVSLLNPPSIPLIRNSAVDVQDENFPLALLEATTTENAPLFVSESQRDFHLNTNNTLWNGGSAQFAISTDLDGLPRNVGLPDKGCYERQQ